MKDKFSIPKLEQHHQYLSLTFETLCLNQLYIKKLKCNLCRLDVEYLGHVILRHVVAGDYKKIEIFTIHPLLKTRHDVGSGSKPAIPVLENQNQNRNLPWEVLTLFRWFVIGTSFKRKSNFSCKARLQEERFFLGC
ncbi:hypothetical protein Dsin_016949 [Dipteronia sinensis]|uniref:Uncharacterized protein n=1 Tax=Dipteronia sinensis TaxID=43782 RepID=A0AAE0E7F9_9ROSI|nr:hypothetical protein Dsin_016949 [Dipteronia sinensis]